VGVRWPQASHVNVRNDSNSLVTHSNSLVWDCVGLQLL
jgi:hypothetical protein